MGRLDLLLIFFFRVVLATAGRFTLIIDALFYLIYRHTDDSC